MGIHPRQPRPGLASGAPYSRTFPSSEPVMSLEDRAQQALDFAAKAGRYLPVVGPAYETYEDLRDGNYAGAAFNAAMLAADLSPAAPVLRMLRVVNGINKMRRGAFLARAGTQTNRIRTIENARREAKGIVGEYEVHHTLPMAGWGPIPAAGRKAEGLIRNHPAFLKPLDKEAHRRLTGRFTRPDGTVMPQFDPVMRAWHGTNALQKAMAASTAANVADQWENVARPFPSPNPGGQRR